MLYTVELGIDKSICVHVLNCSVDDTYFIYEA